LATLREQGALDKRLREIEERMRKSTVTLAGSRNKWADLRRAEMFWDRTFSELTSASQAEVDSLCGEVGVDYIVTGHTQQTCSRNSLPRIRLSSPETRWTALRPGGGY